MSIFSRERSVSFARKVAGPLTGLLISLPVHEAHAIDYVTPLIVPQQQAVEEIENELRVLNIGQPKDFVAWTRMQVEKAEREEAEERKEREYWSLGENVPPEIKRWERLIVKYSRLHDIDPKLVAAVMMVESKGEAGAYNPSGARGLMQILHGPWDPEANIARGVELLAGGIKEYDDLDLALAFYNAGPQAIRKYGGVPPYPETLSHIRLTHTYRSRFIGEAVK